LIPAPPSEYSEKMAGGPDEKITKKHRALGQDPAEKITAERPALGHTILVVEDDKVLRESLGEALRDHGWKVVTATDGTEALAAVRERRPDLVLLDLMMPGMNGWQFLKAIQEEPTFRGLSVFIITAADNPASVGGGYPIFIKPLNLERLVDTMRRFLR
jgi:CheY-like chemotaxis protein